MQDGLLGGNIKPTDLVFGKSDVITRIFVVLDLVPPNELRCFNELRCLTCENRIATLYVNVRDNRVRTQDV